VRYLPSYIKEGDWNLFRGLIDRSYHFTLLSSAVVMVVGGGLVLAWDLAPNEKITFLLGLLLGPLIALTDLISCQLEGEKRFESAYFLDIFLAPVLLLAIVGLLALTLHSFGHLAAILAVTGVQAVMLIIMLVAFLRTQPVEAKGLEPHYRTKKWFKVALPVLIMTGFMVIVYRADLFVVGMYLGRHDAGIYAAVLTIAGFLAFFLKAVDSATNPEIAPCFKAGHLVILQRLSRLVAQISFWPTLLLSVAFVIFGNQLLDLFGDGFRPGYIPLAILCMSWVIKGASGAPGYLLLMTGNQMKLVINFTFMVALDLVLLILLTIWLGLPGAALASTLSIMVSRVALVVVAQKATGIHTSILAGIFGGQVQDRQPRAKG
jgi:O-antigen/teichoic acid export membrane protein